MTRAVWVILVMILGFGLAAPTPILADPLGGRMLVAQSDKPRTLFDLLFGRREKKTKPAAPSNTTPSSSPSIITLPPAKPKVEKTENAARLAVFGDSLATDLARALTRAHADDPDLVVIGQGVGSSGFVRDDFFDWNAAIEKAIGANTFDIAVVLIGINDRQPIRTGESELKSLTDPWKAAYSARLDRFLSALRAAGKPVIWVGLPPMRAPTYSAAVAQISALQKLAAFSGGAEFVDIYDRFTNEDGAYSSYGPDLNGQNVLMRKSDGIHFSTAGANKLAFYVDQVLKRFYRGGALTVEISDPLAGTDAANMMRLPFQGLGQGRKLEIAGAVMPLGAGVQKASALVEAGTGRDPRGFDLSQMATAPKGRADAFGVGGDAEASATEAGSSSQ